MRDFISLFFLCVVFQTFQDLVICRQRHHKHLSNHLIRKRSTLQLHKAPVNSLVEDVSESTTFHTHDKKLQAIAQAGEMYPEHKVLAAKRKDIIPKTNKLTKKIKDDDKEDDDDDNDDNDDDKGDDKGEKKFKIQKEESNTDDSDEKINDNDSDADSDDDDESGSGNDEDSDDETTKDDDKDDDIADTKTKCRKRCKMPLTFHQCAFPRCSQKLGTIKDLCFYLCKHQKERCEQVCD